jgi:hypothetical protein
MDDFVEGAAAAGATSAFRIKRTEIAAGALDRRGHHMKL